MNREQVDNEPSLGHVFTKEAPPGILTLADITGQAPTGMPSVPNVCQGMDPIEGITVNMALPLPGEMPCHSLP